MMDKVVVGDKVMVGMVEMVVVSLVCYGSEGYEVDGWLVVEDKDGMMMDVKYGVEKMGVDSWKSEEIERVRKMVVRRMDLVKELEVKGLDVELLCGECGKYGFDCECEVAGVEEVDDGVFGYVWGEDRKEVGGA